MWVSACLCLVLLLHPPLLHQPSPLAAAVTATFTHDYNRQLKTASTAETVPLGGDTAALCARWGLRPAGGRGPRVFDLFIASHELDMMEIRVQELYTVVDQILILESRQTFRGKPKPLAYPRVLSRLPGEAVSKIHYTVLDMLEGSGPWEKETFQRNQLVHLGLASSGFKPEPDDILIVSDLDEIPKPDFVRAMKTCEGIAYPAALLSHYHYYSFDYKGDYEWDMGPRALTARQSTNLTAQQLRKEAPGLTKYSNTSWHCSYCFNSAAMLQNKLSSFSHAEFDTPFYHNLSRIVRCLREGWGLFQSDIGQKNAKPQYTPIPHNELDMPQFLREHKDRFAYLVSRRGSETAGLADVVISNGLPTLRQHTNHHHTKQDVLARIADILGSFSND